MKRGMMVVLLGVLALMMLTGCGSAEVEEADEVAEEAAPVLTEEETSELNEDIAGLDELEEDLGDLDAGLDDLDDLDLG